MQLLIFFIFTIICLKTTNQQITMAGPCPFYIPINEFNETSIEGLWHEQLRFSPEIPLTKTCSKMYLLPEEDGNLMVVDKYKYLLTKKDYTKLWQRYDSQIDVYDGQYDVRNSAVFVHPKEYLGIWHCVEYSNSMGHQEIYRIFTRDKSPPYYLMEKMFWYTDYLRIPKLYLVKSCTN